MKEQLIKRYINTIKKYFEYPGDGEGKRAILYVLQEYQQILIEEFDIPHEEVRRIYDDLYTDYYLKP